MRTSWLEERYHSRENCGVGRPGQVRYLGYLPETHLPCVFAGVWAFFCIHRCTRDSDCQCSRQLLRGTRCLLVSGITSRGRPGSSCLCTPLDVPQWSASLWRAPVAWHGAVSLLGRNTRNRLKTYTAEHYRHEPPYTAVRRITRC